MKIHFACFLLLNGYERVLNFMHGLNSLPALWDALESHPEARQGQEPKFGDQKINTRKEDHGNRGREAERR